MIDPVEPRRDGTSGQVEEGRGAVGPLDRSRLDALLDQEEGLADLHAVVIALDLIASGSACLGIEAADMAGLKIVARQARALAEGVRKAWRENTSTASPISRGRA